MPAEEKDLQRAAKLIAEVHIAMLTTLEENGELRSRPMAVQQAPFDGTLRFLTRDDSGKVDEINRERQVNVAISDPDKGIFVSVSGKAGLNRDRAKIRELWDDAFSVWFPEGPDGEHLAALEVDAGKIEFWNTEPGQDHTSREKEEKDRDQSEHGTVDAGKA